MDILDLYRGNLIGITYELVDKQMELPPVQLMIFHNDCMFLSYYCKMGFIKINALPPPKKSIFFLSSAFELLANKFIAAQLNLHYSSFRDFVEYSEGFGVENEQRRAVVEKTFKKIIYHLNHITSIIKVRFFIHLH